MQNKPKEEIDLLILKLRDRLQNVLLSNKKFDNDFYLYRWLLQFHMKVDTTAKAIEESIEWRKANNVEELAEREWGSGSGLEKEIRSTYDSFTKIGQPVTTSDGGNIDMRAIFRKYSRDSFKELLIQFVAKLENLMLENYKKKLEADSNSCAKNSVKSSSSSESEGGNSNLNSGYHPSWFSAAPIHIVSYKNFSMSNLTHLEGIQVYLELAKIGFTYFPSVISEIYVVNLNKFSGALAKLLKPIIASDAFFMEFYDTDKSKWTSKLLEIVDEDQLPVYFGGTYIESESNDTLSKNELI